MTIYRSNAVSQQVNAFDGNICPYCVCDPSRINDAPYTHSGSRWRVNTSSVRIWGIKIHTDSLYDLRYEQAEKVPMHVCCGSPFSRRVRLDPGYTTCILHGRTTNRQLSLCSYLSLQAYRNVRKEPGNCDRREARSLHYENEPQSDAKVKRGGYHAFTTFVG